MALTPADVEGKTFGTALRGYDLDEVDDFLDDVVATLRDLQDQLASARVVEPESTEPPVIADESAVGRALIAAQATGDTIISDAREESERILNEARGEAETWASERDAKKTEADAEMAELTRHVSDVRTQLALLATTVADSLDEMDLAIGGQTEPTVTGDVDNDEGDANDLPDDDEEVESFDLDDQETSSDADDGDSSDEDEEAQADVPDDASEEDGEELDDEPDDASEEDGDELDDEPDDDDH